ncbi:tRNA lysidine(34) synthetase TilS [Buchnera aphidicola (Neophyllaphis varicolor)]|uniref:tRNA lysidine(34) synthetase TilS n=1 Tax=Buchnera aphidicola TaxID=9 RepID=UPI0031B7FE90
MIENIIKKNKKLNHYFLIAYSGGLDSTVLLDKLTKIRNINKRIKIRAIHINHNLNKNSEKWEEHCIKECKKKQVYLITKKIFINKKNGNIQDQARKKRYDLIKKYILHQEILLTAHHIDDQCETVLLSLKRGSGPLGLSGIKYKSIFNKKNFIIRPLIKNTKIELENYANKNSLKWIEDSSNYNKKYDRNFLRNKILPLIKNRWPYFVVNVNRSAENCNEQEKLINEFISEIFQNYLKPDGSLEIKNFNKISKEKQNAIIKKWISKNNNFLPSKKILEIIKKEVIGSKIDANPQLIIKNNQIRRYNKCLFWIKKFKSIKRTILMWHYLKKPLKLIDNLGYLSQNKKKGIKILIPKKNQLVNIRFITEGKINILGKNNKKKIKKIWQELYVPPWNRQRIPLIFYDDKLIAAVGKFITKEGKPKKNKQWYIYWNINQI